MPSSLTASAQELAIQPGRTLAPWTKTPEWITVAAIRQAAKQLYTTLAMFLDSRGGDQMVYPSQATLAALCGLSRYDKIKPYRDELEALGAIDVTHVPVPGGYTRCVITVHETPPSGYAGPRSLPEWLDRREAEKPQVTTTPPNEGVAPTCTNPTRGSKLSTTTPRNEGVATPRNGGMNQTFLNQRSPLPPSAIPAAAGNSTEAPAEGCGLVGESQPSPDPDGTAALRAEAAEVFAGLDPHQPVQSGKHVGHYVAARQAGHSRATLAQALNAKDPERVRSRTGLWSYRLAQVAQTPAIGAQRATQPQQSACKHCGASKHDPVPARRVYLAGDNPAGLGRPCPECVPTAEPVPA